MKSPEEKVFSLYELTIYKYTPKKKTLLINLLGILKSFFFVHIFRRFTLYMYLKEKEK